MKKTNIVLIFNGLGNQMSQYAFYLAMHDRMPNTKYICWDNDHNGYELDRLFNIPRHNSVLKIFLTTIYGRPEEWQYPENPKLIFRDKNRLLGTEYIDNLKQRSNRTFLQRLKSPYIITVHDMIHERFSNLFKYEDHTSKDKRELLLVR